MDGIVLREGEVLLLQEAGVTWRNDSLGINNTCNELMLTNYRICGMYKKSNGIFKASTEEIVEVMLTDIKTVGKELSVQRKWSFDLLDYILEVYTKQGANRFIFSSSRKDKTLIWQSEIYRAVLGKEPPAIANADAMQEGISKVKAGLKGFAAATMDKFSEIEKPQINFKQEQSEPCVSEVTPPPLNMHQPQATAKFCMNCGSKLNEGSKFCHACGTSVGNVATPETVTNTRVQEYAGTIVKCPNCGNVLNSMEVVCSACGMHLSGRGSSVSVQKLSEQLMQIEAASAVSDKYGIFSAIGREEREAHAREEASRQKVTLINTFPVPYSISEVYDFMLMAIANIDTRLSKNSVMNKFSKNAPGDPERHVRAVSNAWLAKMQEVYKKAKNLFTDDPAFTEIHNMYVSKMRELKMEEKI